MLLSGTAFMHLVTSEAPSLLPSKALVLYSGEFHVPPLAEAVAKADSLVPAADAESAADAQAQQQQLADGGCSDPPPAVSTSQLVQMWRWRTSALWPRTRGAVGTASTTAEVDGARFQSLSICDHSSRSRVSATPATADSAAPSLLASLYQVSHCYSHCCGRHPNCPCLVCPLHHCPPPSCPAGYCPPA